MAKAKSDQKKNTSSDEAYLNTSRQGDLKVPIVAIGASAGGLEPFEQFFDAMSPDTGVAFVVIQHLSPDFESMMDELLSRHSTMDIKRVTQDLIVEPNTIYLNSPRSDMIIKNGRFSLNARSINQHLNLPIDIFFASLASEYTDKSIAIILSGTGSDGTRGASIIKDAGGVVIAQSPSTAKFDGMPRSVIDSGHYDAVAAPTEMPALIEQIISGQTLENAEREDIADDPARYAFRLLRDKYGTDFGYYKEATLVRRFERRAKLSGEDIDVYAKRLANDTDELDSLYADLLIDVTSFFRDKKAFEAIIEKVIRPLGKKMSPERQIRVWVPGCSSGEEAYSLAIGFAEYARKNKIDVNLKILATDVHQRSLGAAAQGIYPKDSLLGLSDEIIERYFEKHVDYYQINPDLRRLVVFSQHNLLRDPPFTRIDFVSCRNVLIYFQEKAQEKTLALFHFSLAANGYLFLGPSEALNKLADEFDTLDRRWNIFRKLRDVRLMEATSLLPRSSTVALKVESPPPFFAGKNLARHKIQRAHGEALEILLKRYAPSGFLLNKNADIVHVFGKGGEFVKIGKGVFSNRIIDLIEPQLQLAVTTGLERITASSDAQYKRQVIVEDDDGKRRSVSVIMQSLSDKSAATNHILLTFEEATAPKETLPVETAQLLDTNESVSIMQQHIQNLERDLQSTEQSLQSMVEELQTSNEELQATNEELMASNEELQSTNEELHSVNEELYTVSSEHQRKIDELTILSDDMNHLLRATSIGILFLDDANRIRRFTPSATAAFNLLDQDVGRPFEHTTYCFTNIDVLSVLKQVKESGVASEQEIIVDDKEFLLNILPYKTSIRDRSGTVMTIVDVSEFKAAERARTAEKAIFENVVSDLSEAILRVDLKDNTIVLCNEPFVDLYKTTSENVVGDTLENAIGKDAASRTLKLVKKCKPGETFKDQVVLNEKTPDEKIISRRIRIIGNENDDAVAFQATGLDVTEQVRYSEALEALVDIEETSGIDFNDAIKKVLEIGTRYLSMPIGIIAKLDKNDANIQHSHGLNAKALKNKTYKQGHFLKKLLPSDFGPLSIYDVANSNLADQVLFSIDDIKAFIGIRLSTSQGAYGSLTFLSDKQRSRNFTDMECTMVQLMAANIGTLLERKEQYMTLDLRRQDLEDLNEGLNRFTYLASHDLQEPLRKIQQSGEFLETDFGDLLNEEGQYFLKIMRGSAGRMRSLIDDLLLYSASANQELKTESVNLKDLVEAAAKELATQIEEKDATLNIKKLPKVECDENVVKQIFINVIGNSLKYAKADTAPIINISSKKLKSETRIKIEDNGIGLNIFDDINIFEPFVRLHSKTEYKGSGIGLAICKSICDRHGWSIDAESEIDIGTTITISIPNSQIN